MENTVSALSGLALVGSDAHSSADWPCCLLGVLGAGSLHLCDSGSSEANVGRELEVKGPVDQYSQSDSREQIPGH